MSAYNNIRTCVSCRQKKNKEDMIKITLSKNGQITVDEASFGRSAYVCRNEKCVSKCVQNKLLNRAFKREVVVTVYDKLGETEL